MNEFFALFPRDVVNILLVLGLSFLIGLEREEEKSSRDSVYFFGGVRTFPLIALMGYVLVVISPNNILLFSVGFLVLGILLAVSYWSKLVENKHGVTSEMSGLLTFLIGGGGCKRNLLGCHCSCHH